MPGRALGSRFMAFLALALAGALWALPFVSHLHFHPIPTFHGELVAGMLGLGAVSAWLVGRGARPAIFPPAAFLPVFLACLIVLQFALGRLEYAEDGVTGALFLLWAACLVWLAAELRDRFGVERVVVVFAWCALMGALASTSIGIFQYYAPEVIGRFAMKRMSPGIYANLGQSNHLAHQLALGLGSLVYLAATRRLSAAAAFLAAAPILFVVALTLSRSAWLYFITFSILAAFHRGRLESAEGRRLLVGSLLLLPCLAAAQLAVLLPFLQPASHVISPMDRLFEVASGWAPRVAVWKEAWQMYASAPWTGVGFGQFAWHHFLQVSAVSAAQAPGLYDQAHNLVLQLMAELGLFAAAATVLTTIAWVTGVLHERASPERWWVLALAAVAGIHSMLEYPLWYAYFLAVAALLAGLGDRRRMLSLQVFPLRLVLVPAIATGWALCAWLYFDYSRVEGLSFNLFTAGSGGDRMVRVRETLREADGRSLLQPYLDLGLATAEPLGRERLTEKLARNTRALRFAPTREIVYRQAVLLALDGEAEAARSQLARAAAYYPGFLATFARVLKELEGTDPEAIGPLLRYSEERLYEPRRDAVRPN